TSHILGVAWTWQDRERKGRGPFRQGSCDRLLTALLVESRKEHLSLSRAALLVQKQDFFSPIVDGWMCCPKGWRRFQGSCYFLSTDMMSWDKSAENCTGMGSQLVVITSKAEQVSAQGPRERDPAGRATVLGPGGDSEPSFASDSVTADSCGASMPPQQGKNSVTFTRKRKHSCKTRNSSLRISKCTIKNGFVL
uniref:Uncharacterized protein n=1 Tax=Junco hyemalis TaxID=40217 RepID=A0A8C5NPX2_JUNHY